MVGREEEGRSATVTLFDIMGGNFYGLDKFRARVTVREGRKEGGREGGGRIGGREGKGWAEGGRN